MQSRHHTVAPNGSIFSAEDAIYRSWRRQTIKWVEALSPTSIVVSESDLEDYFINGHQAEDAADEIFREYEDAK
jgi:hypothetical protein